MGYYELAKTNPRIFIFETLLVAFVLLVAFFLAQFFGQIISQKIIQDSGVLGRFLQLILSILILLLFVWLIYDCGPNTREKVSGLDRPLVSGAFAEALDPSVSAID